MTHHRAHVIVGAGLAGAKAAQALRDEGFDGPVVLIGDETELPYERPPLSKSFLAGTTDREQLLVHPPDWYREHDVDLRTGSPAVALDRQAHEVRLADGSSVGYAALLLATGCSPRRVDLPGADLEGVLYLRTLADSVRIRQALHPGTRVVVIGGGWIGLETAAAARSAECQVTVLERSPLPLLRVLGPEAAQVFADLHQEQGVVLRTGAQVAALTGAGAAVDTVLLHDGTRIPADIVIVGVGVLPNDHVAQAAGLATGNGIVVDAQLRTSDPAVFAAGDVANAFHPLLARHVRTEHWANALHQPQTAARAMLGHDDVYDRLPYFYSDQYDLGMEYTGYVEPGGYEQVVFRGDLAKRSFIAFWVHNGQVLAGMNVNVWDVTDQIRALIRAANPVDTARLADPDVPLESLLQG